MQTNMKIDWVNDILLAANAPYTTLIKMSALWIDRRKIVIGDKLYIKNGMILPQKETPDNEYTHHVIQLEGTTANTKHRITLENRFTNQIENIDL